MHAHDARRQTQHGHKRTRIHVAHTCDTNTSADTRTHKHKYNMSPQLHVMFENSSAIWVSLFSCRLEYCRCHCCCCCRYRCTPIATLYAYTHAMVFAPYSPLLFIVSSLFFLQSLPFSSSLSVYLSISVSQYPHTYIDAMSVHGIQKYLSVSQSPCVFV